MKKPFLALLLFFVSCTVDASYKSVTIYYVPWDVMTCTAMKADTVRRIATTKTEISEPWFADRFIEWLDQGKMKHDPRREVRDLRLVIDAVQEDGSIETFYADRGALASQKTGMQRPIDDSFRSRFSFFYDK